MAWARWVKQACELYLEIIAKELSVTMGFCGVVDINALDSSALIAPTTAARPEPGGTHSREKGGIAVPLTHPYLTGSIKCS